MEALSLQGGPDGPTYSGTTARAPVSALLGPECRGVPSTKRPRARSNAMAHRHHGPARGCVGPGRRRSRVVGQPPYSRSARLQPCLGERRGKPQLARRRHASNHRSALPRMTDSVCAMSPAGGLARARFCLAARARRTSVTGKRGPCCIGCLGLTVEVSVGVSSSKASSSAASDCFRAI